MIKFDLHIHSYASKYKEAKNIVNESTIENAEILLAKLNEQDVSLFSITDHNRFWPELYIRLNSLISSGKYPNVKSLVAGVEFDVQMDPEMSKCHIITIFNTMNAVDNYNRINDVINANLIETVNGAYSRNQFENLLREIGLDTILIACQRSGLDRHKGNHNSLSESTMEPEKLILTGYINALEFQKPNVEGILRNNLKEVPTNVLLVMGSDCHEWKAYPYHDSANMNLAFQHSRAKILPTFKGLLMAVTSPETRINPQENRNRDFISSFRLGKMNYPLANGINAIIGENGSGKSTLLKLFHEDQKDQYVRNLIKKNEMSSESVDLSKRLYIGQGDIVSRFNGGKLFPNENFIEVDKSEFEEIYTNYASDVLEYIKKRIDKKKALIKLDKDVLRYNEIVNESNYFIHFEVDEDYSDIVNKHSDPNNDLKKLLKSVSEMIRDDYYAEYEKDLSKIYGLLLGIYAKVHCKYDRKEIEKKVKNSIVSASNNYDIKIKEAATSRENDRRDFFDQKQSFTKNIVNAIRKNAEELKFPEAPKPISGFSTNSIYGFNFNLETGYHNKSVLQDFLSTMFVKEYAKIEMLEKIDSIEVLKAAIKGCNNPEEIDDKYENNLNIFLKQMCDCKKYIVDISEGEASLGNTLGEMSLAYFKYLIEQENDKSVFLIDQPEDHISNNNISKKLLTYFNSIRNEKQIVIVTHNPLLVVNQDVDNVIFMQKVGEKIEIISGCLEQENEQGNILDIIANNMDGGKESIEKRLKVYG